MAIGPKIFELEYNHFHTPKGFEYEYECDYVVYKLQNGGHMPRSQFVNSAIQSVL